MDDFVAMHDLNPSQKLSKNVDCFIDSEDSTVCFALNRVEISHITILHDQEVPISLCIDDELP